MADIEVPFATQAGESSVPQNSREKLVNMYAEMEVTGRKRLVRRQRPGLRAVLSAAGEKRCVERHKGEHYAVIGNSLVKFDGTTSTTLGTIGSNTGRCSMIFDDNGRIMVSDGATGYYWNGTAISTVSTPGSVSVGTLAFQGGYGVFNVPDTGQFYVTALNDFSTIDALDFATAESYPDPLLRVFVNHNQLLLCGTESIEVWQLSGGTDFPYSPYVNAQIERGLCGSYAICSEDNTVFFVGEDQVVYRLNGYTPTRISTGTIERAIEAVGATALAACEAFANTTAGQKFITFRFPNALTIQFNLATELWSYAQTFQQDDWRVLGSAGHRSDYLLTDAGWTELDNTLNTDEGGIMQRIAVSAPGDANGRRIAVRTFLMDAEVGRADIGKQAEVMMRFAPDGETFGNIRTRSLGSTGDYKRRAMWRNLGQGYKPTVELSCTDDVQFSVMAAICDVSVGSN